MKRLAMILAFAVFIVFGATAPSKACDWCIMTQGISPLETIKGAGVRMLTRYTLVESVYKGTDSLSNPGAKETYLTGEFTGFYGMGETTMLMVVVPLKKTKLNGHLHVHDDGEVEAHPDKGETSEVGDISILARHAFFKRHTLSATTIIAGIMGIKLPTGKTDAKTDDGTQYLDAHLQPGGGSTDMLAGISFSRAMARASLSANFLYAITTKGEAGEDSHKFGNVLNYDATAKYRVHPAGIEPKQADVFLSLGINGELHNREKINGKEVFNSGGHTLYLSPGIQVAADKKWVFELSYHKPIYHNLYGTQLGEDYKVTGGITYLF